MQDRKFMKVSDFILIVFVAALVLFMRFSSAGVAQSGGKVAEISEDGRVVRVMRLDGDELYAPRGHAGVRIMARGGMAGFVGSDCPDKTCVRFGFLSVAGQSAVCLPNRVVLRLVSEGDDGVDSVSY